jgi:hypothetical protein
MSALLEPDLARLPANADEARLARIPSYFIGCVRSGGAMDEVMMATDARWLAHTPLETIYLLTPHPSMPPGTAILAGEKPSGGSQDCCWLVFNKVGTRRSPKRRWLSREGDLFHGQMMGASI